MNTVAPLLTPQEAEARVLHVQTKLHKWASTDPDKQFRDLFNLVCDGTTLQVAWQRIRANRGSRTTGVDGMTRADVETASGLAASLRSCVSASRMDRIVPSRSGSTAVPSQALARCVG